MPWRLRSSGTIAMPARIASSGERTLSGLPSSITVALLVPGYAPNTACMSSVRPAPTRPATPTISPRRTANDTSSTRFLRGLVTSKHVTLRASNTTSPTACSSHGKSCVISRPTIIWMMRSVVSVLMGAVPTCRPSRITVMVSHTASTSSSLCEM